MPKTNGADGRRGPSIRRPLYILVAIPLLTVIGLYAFVLYTTVGDAINLDRAPSLINSTSVPAANFDLNIQNERKASLVYLAAPTAQNRAQLQAAQAATTQAFPGFQAQMTGSSTTNAATTEETAVIRQMLASIQGLSAIRPAILARAIQPTQAFDAFSNIMVEQMKLFTVENASLTNATAATQSQAVIESTESGEFLLQEDALVSAALAAKQLPAATRIEVTQLAGARRALLEGAIIRYDAPDLAVFNAQMNHYAPPAVQTDLTNLENAIAADPTPFPPPQVTPATWSPVVLANASGVFYGGVDAVRAQVQHDQTITNAAWRRVALSGGIGLLGLILSVLLSVLISRWIIRRLGRLRGSVETLANVELPDVVARLRRGEDVPTNEMTATSDLGRDEIGQVGRAFDAARQTAVEAAVGEARMRRGINDVFRNLARRNQSLLHRELTVLDGMERRTTDPETLEDLFRLDHLTTRMRRHSEGLIILSGAAPGRGWVHPVRMIDVLRAAAAEVEDYSRVTVTTPSQAALTGPAVADVIHLLAELIENATTLSPPYTPVRVSGDLVATGFAVEVEDRGLGMSDMRYAELNARLAEPPEFDVFNSEQLGLFVVGQLAKRHGIRVTLRSSPYGGTTAIALIPTALVGMDEGFLEGLPAGRSAGSAAWPAAAQDSLADDTAVQPGQLAGGPSWGALPQGTGAGNGSQGNGSPRNGFQGNGAPRNGSPGGAGGHASSLTGGQGAPDPFGSYNTEPAFGTDPYADQQPYAGQGFGGQGGPANGSTGGQRPDGFGEQPYGTDPYGGQPAYGWTASPGEPSSFGIAGDTGPADTETGLPWPYDRPSPTPNGTGQARLTPGQSPYPPSPAYPQDEAPFPAAQPPFPPAPPPPFPAAESPYPQAEPLYPGAGAPLPPAEAPYSPADAPYSPDEPAADQPLPRRTSAQPDDAAPAGDESYPDADETYKGLPRRVRQANLAPQLRDRPATGGAASAASGDNVANRSPDDIRSALSAMQRGWQQGRSTRDSGSLGDAHGAGPDDALPGYGPDGAAGSGQAGAGDATLTGGDPLARPEGAERASGPGHGTDNGTGNGTGGAAGNGYSVPADYSSDDYSSTGEYPTAAGYGTADSYGVGSVGYPDYAAEPDYSGHPGSTGQASAGQASTGGTDTGRTTQPSRAFQTAEADGTADTGGDSTAVGHDAETGENSTGEQSYRGGNDDI